MMSKSHLTRILDCFEAPVKCCIAYGSGVFTQKSKSLPNGSSGKKETPKMVDFIFGVTHPSHWHSLNLRQNPHHYASLMHAIGSRSIAKVQEMGAGIYYHPHVTVDGTLIKYGVVSMDTLLADLNDWKTFYLAGRLQKPVLMVREDHRVRIANKRNLKAALRTALCLLPQEFTEEELFLKIAGLSYTGDPRMAFAETPYKVLNIVHAQMPLFREIYSPIIDDVPYVNYVSDGLLRKDESERLLINNVDALPETLLIRMKSKRGHKDIASLAKDPKLEEYVQQSIREIVKRPATIQSAKGLLTAGLWRSSIYLAEKIKKRFGFN